MPSRVPSFPPTCAPLSSPSLPFSFLVLLAVLPPSQGGGTGSARGFPTESLSLWIDENQVKALNGIPMEIYAILDGHVLPYILDPNFEKYLPIIPPEVAAINFTWKSGLHRYRYSFELLHSYDTALLLHPTVSIATMGRVPRTTAEFSVFATCSGLADGVAVFGIGLMLNSRRGRTLPGSPLRLRLRKQCHHHHHHYHHHHHHHRFSSSTTVDEECKKSLSNQQEAGHRRSNTASTFKMRKCRGVCRKCHVVSDAKGVLRTQCRHAYCPCNR